MTFVDNDAGSSLDTFAKAEHERRQYPFNLRVILYAKKRDVSVTVVFKYTSRSRRVGKLQPIRAVGKI